MLGLVPLARSNTRYRENGDVWFLLLSNERRGRAHGGHVAKRNARITRELSRKGMVVSGKQHAAVHATRHVAQHRMRDRIPIKRARSSPELVENDERGRRRVAKDRRTLGALHHEGRLTGDDAVSCADAREEGVDWGERKRGRGRMAPDLRENRRHARRAQQR